MGTLFYSFGSMLIISLLAYACLSRITSEYGWAIRSLKLFQEERNIFYDTISKRSSTQYYDLLAKETQESDEETSKLPEECLRNTSPHHPNKSRKTTTSYLHVKTFLSKNRSPRQETEEKLFKNLIHILYKNLPLFPDTTDPSEEILQMLTEAKELLLAQETETGIITSFHELANADFSGPMGFHKYYILTLILDGASTEVIPGKKVIIPRLLDYISTRDFRSCLSLYKAPKPILMALFDDAAIVEELIAFRNDLYQKMTQPHERETEFTTENATESLKSTFSQKIPSNIPIEHIDFTVTKTRPIIHIKERYAEKTTSKPIPSQQ